MTALDGVNGTVCNAQQFQLSLQSYDSRSPSTACLTHGDTNGLAFAAAASFLSCISVVIIFICIAQNIRWYMKKFPNDNWRLFERPADIYMFSLFAFDFLQAIGGILNVRWAHDGIVTTGPYCTAQGLLKQIGDLGVALITLLLAFHTFIAAVWSVGLEARGVAFSLVCLACVFITLWAAIGVGIHKNYETPTPYWCWISPQFPGERLAGETIWMWIALFASVILYIPLYFWAEGYPERRATLRLLLYPLAYSLVILPLTIARWLRFSHHYVSPTVTFFAASIFQLSGAINVLLFLIIRPGLLLFLRPDQLD